MPYGKLAEDILNDWRAAERELATVDAHKDERIRLEREIQRLRDEYNQLAEEATRKHRVVDVPPFTPELPEARQTATEADQKAADADQRASDRDQAASDSDDINAAFDQRQSDRDQARSDRQHSDQPPVSASEETEYVRSRDQRQAATNDRAARTRERNVTSLGRATSAGKRDRVADDRARRSTERDEDPPDA